ncbi:MAG: hypothetical protein ACE5I7_09995 [Candidatus Binatia bacterium]
MAELKLDVSPRKVAWFLAVAIVCLTTASVLSQWYRFELERGQRSGIIDRLYLDNEESIATWFQSAVLLSCAALLGSIAQDKRRTGDASARPWGALAGIFLVLSLDEVAALHELTMRRLRDALHVSGVFYFAWVIPGMLVVLVVGALYVKFILGLDRETRRRVIVAAALYVAGALGMEMVSGAYASVYGVDTLVYATALVTLEELLEMAGMSLFLYALLCYRESDAGLPALPDVGTGIANGNVGHLRVVRRGRDAGGHGLRSKPYERTTSATSTRK